MWHAKLFCQKDHKTPKKIIGH